MNLLLFASHELLNNQLVLSGRRASHILEVLGLGPGDTLRVGELNGLKGRGIVTRIEGGKVILEVTLDEQPPPPAGVDLILALPRPIMLKRILKQATVIGVEQIYLIRSRRVEKSFFHSPALEEETMHRLLVEGLEQAMDTRLPKVSIHHRFKPFVEDVLPKMEGLGLLAHPKTSTLLADLAGERKLKENRILLAVGPEGGWSDYECSRFMEQGFTMFSMGPRILHVDTAVVALLSQISYIRQIG